MLFPLCLAVLSACGMPPPPELDAGIEEPIVDAGPTRPDDPWADRVVRFTPGPGAGFGQDKLPDVVLGPPSGLGDSQGSLDVLALGKGGVI
ncbi:MAG TPA: cell surface protein, partial [Archangium sp.]